MPTNLDLNDKLIAQAQKLGKFRSKKDAVNAALREFIDRRKRREILKWFGKVDLDPGYDYKAERRGDR